MWHKSLICAVLTVAGCTAPGTYLPPVAVSAGFFGAAVTVALNGPNGVTVPAKVVAENVNTPTLIVPTTAPVTTGNVVVTNASGQAASVPVKTGNVGQPVLAVPTS